MKKQIANKNKKQYGHIAVEQKSKTKFENLRFKLIGENKKDITHDDLINILINNYEKKKN